MADTIRLKHGGQVTVGAGPIEEGQRLTLVEVHSRDHRFYSPVNLTPDELRGLIAELLDRDPMNVAFAQAYRKDVQR